MSHICKFEKPLFKIEPLLLGPQINNLINIIEWISMHRKKQKITKKILQCHVCECYQVECPYCQGMRVMAELPLKTTCEHCGKEFRVRWTRI